MSNSLLVYENLSSGGIVSVMRHRIEEEPDKDHFAYFFYDRGGRGAFDSLSNVEIMVGRVGHQKNIFELMNRLNPTPVRLFSHYQLTQPIAATGADVVIEYHRSDEGSLHTIRRFVPETVPIVVPSEWSAQFVGSVWGGTTVVVPNVCNPRVFHPSDSPSKDGEPEYVYVGQTTHQKGLHTVLRAFRQLVDSVGKRNLTVVISHSLDDQQAGGLLREIDRYGLSQLVTVLWSMSQQEVGSVFRRAARSRGLNIIGSTRESFGLVAIEARACGLSTVGPNVSAIPEVIGDTRLLYEMGDAGDLARTLIAWDEREQRNA